MARPNRYDYVSMKHVIAAQTNSERFKRRSGLLLPPHSELIPSGVTAQPDYGLIVFAALARGSGGAFPSEPLPYGECF